MVETFTGDTMRRRDEAAAYSAAVNAFAAEACADGPPARLIRERREQLHRRGEGSATGDRQACYWSLIDCG